MRELWATSSQQGQPAAKAFAAWGWQTQPEGRLQHEQPAPFLMLVCDGVSTMAAHLAGASDGAAAAAAAAFFIAHLQAILMYWWSSRVVWGSVEVGKEDGEEEKKSGASGYIYSPKGVGWGCQRLARRHVAISRTPDIKEKKNNVRRKSCSQIAMVRRDATVPGC